MIICGITFDILIDTLHTHPHTSDQSLSLIASKHLHHHHFHTRINEVVMGRGGGSIEKAGSPTGVLPLSDGVAILTSLTSEEPSRDSVAISEHCLARLLGAISTDILIMVEGRRSLNLVSTS